MLTKRLMIYGTMLWIGAVLLDMRAAHAASSLDAPVPAGAKQQAYTSGMSPADSSAAYTVFTAQPPKSTADSPGKDESKSDRELDAIAAAARANAPAEPAEVSSLEKAVSAAEKGGETAQPQPYKAGPLVQFGYNFFRPTAVGFAPLTDVPVGGDYPLGPGDRINLNLWGSVEGSHELQVNRNGEIFLPRVGAVKVSGVTFGRLHGVLKSHLAKAFKDFDLNVTMGKLRVIKVFVVGEVRAPGDYNLNALSTLINALTAAGGPIKSGTLRNVQVKRGGETVETIDLYDFFLNGDKSRDIRLQSGDTVFVPVIGRVAAIGGNVKRPAIYELKNEKNLADLVDLAGGFLPTGYLQRVHLSRVEAHEKNMVADFNVDPKSAGKSLQQTLAAVTIQDMDIVKIFPIDVTVRDHVRLAGYALRPGDYALQPGMHLSTLLSMDNLLPEYYRDAAKITRLYPPDFHKETLFVNLDKALANDPQHDLELKEFDTVTVFSRWEMEEMPKVRINGEVQRPGQYRFSNNMTVRDLLMEAGNLKITAYLKNAEINRTERSGEAVSSFPITINLEEALKGNQKDNLQLLPFDELTVRRIPNWAEETERYIALKGEFRFPGVYPIFKGEKLDAVIKRAGGFTERAYLRGAKFTRLSIKEMQQKRMREVLFKTEQEIIKKQSDLAATASSKEEIEATRAALEGLQRNIELLKSVEAEGRLVINLQTSENFNSSIDNVVVAGGDTLEVPQTPSSVNVLGQVYNPTSLIPVATEDVAYYLAKSGGPTKDADESSIYVVKTDGTIRSKQQYSFFSKLIFSGFMSEKMEPGDTIIVPQEFEKIAWMREIKDMTIILGQIALSAGVLIAANL